MFRHSYYQQYKHANNFNTYNDSQTNTELPINPLYYFEQPLNSSISRKPIDAVRRMSALRASQWNTENKHGMRFVQPAVRNRINKRHGRTIFARKDDSRIITNPKLREKLREYGAIGNSAGEQIARTDRLLHFRNNLELLPQALKKYG